MSLAAGNQPFYAAGDNLVRADVTVESGDRLMRQAAFSYDSNRHHNFACSTLELVTYASIICKACLCYPVLPGSGRRAEDLLHLRIFRPRRHGPA